MTDGLPLWRASTANEVMDAAMAHLDRRRSRRVIHYPYADLDDLLGPMVPGELITVTSDREAGRSTLAFDVCRSAVLAQGRSALLVTGAVSPRDVGIRLLAAEARVPHAHLRRGDLREGDSERLTGTEAALRSSGLVVAQQRASYSETAALAYRAWLAHDIDLVVIDDADHMKLDVHDQRTLLGSLRELAAQLQVPVVATGQIYRLQPSSDAPDQRELWGPAGEEGVSISIALHRPDVYGESASPGEVFLTVRRVGDDPEELRMSFQSHYSRLVNMARTTS